MKSRRLVLGTSLVFAFAAACSDDRTAFDGALGPLGPTDGGECPVSCSDDQLSVVSCRGEKVACPPGQGCFGGVCIAACEAASARESTVGCEYYAASLATSSTTEPEGLSPLAGSCYAILLANVWNTPVKIDLDYGGRALDSSFIRIPRGTGTDLSYDLMPDGLLPPGQLGVAFLAFRDDQLDELGSDPDRPLPCPPGVDAAVLDQTWIDASGRGRTFHVKTSAPVVAYDIFPFGGAKSYFPSASLLLPVAALGTNYFVLGGYWNESGTGTWPYFQVLATEDATTVKVRPTLGLVSGPGAPGARAGETTSFTIQKGEYVQFAHPGEANGTVIETDKKVGVVSATGCTVVPSNSKYACDTIHQALLPVKLFGNRYVATRYRDRLSGNDTNTEIVPWRILATTDGTVLTYDPPLPQAPKTLDSGKWAEFLAPGPFVVSSQDAEHPIDVVTYMTGAAAAFDPTFESDYAIGGTSWGDPEFVNIVPADQHLSNYLFLTDPTYRNTNLVFVRKKANGAFADVTLDCIGPVTGWQPIGAGGEFEMARVDIVKKGLPFGDCNNGVHRAASAVPFGLTVWGFDEASSYGFPAGMAAKRLNTVVVPADPH